MFNFCCGPIHFFWDMIPGIPLKAQEKPLGLLFKSHVGKFL